MMRYFNPRPRKEGDGIRWLTSAVPSDFNPRPRKEGDSLVIKYRQIINYFNPRPRKEGDVPLSEVSPGLEISIHALVKRATLY